MVMPAERYVPGMQVRHEQPLVERAKMGDTAAMTVLLEKYDSMARAKATWVAGTVKWQANDETLHDIIQNAQERIWKKRAVLLPEVGFWPLYATIVHDCAVDEVRRLSRRSKNEIRFSLLGAQFRHEPAPACPLPDDEWLNRQVDHEADPTAEAAWRRARVAALAKCIRQLTSLKQQEALILKHQHDRVDSEIAELMGCSKNTVKTHLQRGMEKLRECMQFWSEADHG